MLDDLTPTQREILRLLCAGLTNKQIARLRRGSARSVEWHREEIRRKIGINNPIQLGFWAAQNGVQAS